MRKTAQLKLVALVIFLIFGVAVLLTGEFAGPPAHAFSSGPPAGFTHAPGEFDCSECHLISDPGTGKFDIDAPVAYVPGQRYRITVRHANTDPTRVRWGFQLTALDASDGRAGAFEPIDGTTQALSGDGPFPTRQYIEHTSSGTFGGQQGGASWAFNWTAPATDVGPVTFYAAGNQANGDGNTSGDNIYFTFTSASPAPPSPDFALSAAPRTRLITPASSTTYALTLTPQNSFSGGVAFSLSGLPAGASADFNPPAVNLSGTAALASTLTVTTTNATPNGTFPLTITATSGALTHTESVTLVVASASSADLSITMTDSPDPVSVAANLTYRIDIANNGPSAATNVTVTDTLPPNVTFISATPAQGGCTGALNLTCALGSLAVGASTNVQVVVQPQTLGPLSNSASASAAESDPTASNNTATTTTLVEEQGRGPRMLVPDLGVRTLVSGLNSPTSLAFIGVGDMLVLEKMTGKVQRVRGGRIEATVLDLAVNNASERGLLGIALHPAFDTNHFVYLYWTESSTGADTSATGEVPLLGNRIDRYIWTGSALTFERNLIRLRAAQADAGQPLRGNHNGGVLRFGPDGKLYVVIGDEGRRGLLQNVTSGAPVPDDQFGGPEPDDAHLTGVILRLNDDGTTPADNPFAGVSTSFTGEAAANVRKIFAYGIRNSFGMDFDPVSGALWMQENGDDAFDEINRITPGMNGGWIQLMGPSSRVAQFKSIEVSRAGGLQQLRWPPTLIADTPEQALAHLFMLPGAHYEEPEFSWKYAVAPSPLAFVRGPGLGARYANSLFVGASRTTLLGGFLFRFNLTADRRHLSFDDPRLSADLVADNNDKFDLSESESLLVGRDFGITTDIQTGPDGSLYVVSLSDGAVYQIFATNPADDTTFFVRQHYLDFLSREPDAAGLAFWTNQINQCGDDAHCREARRVNVSAAFFLSIEFQQTGYYVYRFYEASFKRQPRFAEFLPDTQEIGRGIIVGQGDWQAQLESRKQSFAEQWVARPAFRSIYDALANAQYVDRLFSNAGVTPSAAERDALVAGLNAGSETRASVLRRVVENAEFRRAEFNRAFVLMQYFGYLRRNPDDAPDADFSGYNFWLEKLNRFGGNFVEAEMVKAFIVSGEYRRRFSEH